MDLSVTVKSDGNPDVEIHDPDNGLVVAANLSLGERNLRRGEIESPFVPGTYYSYEIEDQGNLTIGVRVSGESTSQVADRISAVKDAFSLPEYELHMTIDGMTMAWTCYPADFSMSAQREHWHARVVTIAFDVPRHPIPIEGPF